MSEIADKQTLKDKQAKELADTAPHRIINWVATQDTINAGLGQCSVCNTKGMKLVEVSRTSLASTVGIECETCKRRKEAASTHFFTSSASIKIKRLVSVMSI